MKIALYSRPRTNLRPEELQSLFEALHNQGFSYQLNEEFARQIESEGWMELPLQSYLGSEQIDPQVQVMVSYGGDGTFLEAVHLLEGRPIPIIGVNSGRLGFLANITPEDMNSAFEAISQGNYSLRSRSLLHAQGDFHHQPDSPYAFNEMAIQRQGASMVQVEVLVNGELIASVHGDGLLVSTPAGSTAYSISVGGPVVAPECHCMIIAPIAPHNLTMRPVVVPDSSRVTLRVHTREQGCYVSLDNRNYTAFDGAVFEIKKAERQVFLVHLQNISFYDTLRNKMMWGVDRRDCFQEKE